jgi:hypothetical protein
MSNAECKNLFGEVRVTKHRYDCLQRRSTKRCCKRLSSQMALNNLSTRKLKSMGDVNDSCFQRVFR